MDDKKGIFLLTTIDNPYNPFIEWKEWYMEDLRLGHDTCGLIARMCSDSGVFKEKSELAAMRDIVINNFSGKHIMVTKQEFSELIKTPV